jgi:hypothetical protein
LETAILLAIGIPAALSGALFFVLSLIAPSLARQIMEEIRANYRDRYPSHMAMAGWAYSMLWFRIGSLVAFVLGAAMVAAAL